LNLAGRKLFLAGRALARFAGQENDMSFPDYDPGAWAEVLGYQDMPWTV
jgi:hypothetical protein